MLDVVICGDQSLIGVVIGRAAPLRVGNNAIIMYTAVLVSYNTHCVTRLSISYGESF